MSRRDLDDEKDLRDTGCEMRCMVIDRYKVKPRLLIKAYHEVHCQHSLFA